MSDYPWFTGFADERGSGPGYGFNVNMPLPLETGDEVYCDALEWALEKEVGTWVPRLPHFVRDMVRKVLAIPQKPVCDGEGAVGMIY